MVMVMVIDQAMVQMGEVAEGLIGGPGSKTPGMSMDILEAVGILGQMVHQMGLSIVLRPRVFTT